MAHCRSSGSSARLSKTSSIDLGARLAKVRAASLRFAGSVEGSWPVSRLTVVLARLHCSASAGLRRLVRVNDFRYYSRFELRHKRSVCENKSRFHWFLRRTVMVQCFVDAGCRCGDADENAVRTILPTRAASSNCSPKPKLSSRLPNSISSAQLRSRSQYWSSRQPLKSELQSKLDLP